MSNASHTSNESHRLPPRTQSVPSSPGQRDSITLTEVASPAETPSFPLTLVANYEQDSNSDHNTVPRLVELERDEYPPVSPGSAETVLALDPLLALDSAVVATVRATAYGLISTIRQRTAESTQKLQEVEHKIAQLEAINRQRTEDNRQLRARLGLISIPDGFERNAG
jgi:hypothetical protein